MIRLPSFLAKRAASRREAGLGALTRQASPLVVGRLLSAALTFVLPLALARALDPSAFGSYKQLFLVAQTVLLAGQLGLTQSLYYFLPRKGARRGAFLAQALLCLGALAAAIAAGLWLGGAALARHLGDGALGELRVPLALLSAGLLLAAPLEAALTSEGRIGLSAVSYVASDVARASLLLAGAKWGGLPGLAWAAAIYAGLRVGALALAVAGGLLPIAAPAGAALRAQVAYALPLAGSVWLWVAQKQFAQYAVAARFDAATFALFAVAAFHLPVVDIVYAPLGEVLIVRLGRSADAAARLREWDDAVEKLASLLWPAAACAWLLGPTLLPLLFTHKYAGAVPLFLLATVEIPLWALPADGVLKACNATRFLFGWFAVRVALTAGAVLGGLAVAGLAGAIAGGITVEAASRAVMLWRACPALGVPLRRCLDWPALGRIAAASAAAALPAWLARRMVDGFAGVVAAALVYGAVYLGVRFAVPLRPRAAAAAPSLAPA